MPLSAPSSLKDNTTDLQGPYDGVVKRLIGELTARSDSSSSEPIFDSTRSRCSAIAQGNRAQEITDSHVKREPRLPTLLFEQAPQSFAPPEHSRSCSRRAPLSDCFAVHSRFVGSSRSNPVARPRQRPPGPLSTWQRSSERSASSDCCQAASRAPDNEDLLMRAATHPSPLGISPFPQDFLRFSREESPSSSESWSSQPMLNAALHSSPMHEAGRKKRQLQSDSKEPKPSILERPRTTSQDGSRESSRLIQVSTATGSNPGNLTESLTSFLRSATRSGTALLDSSHSDEGRKRSLASRESLSSKPSVDRALQKEYRGFFSDDGLTTSECGSERDGSAYSSLRSLHKKSTDPQATERRMHFLDSALPEELYSELSAVASFEDETPAALEPPSLSAVQAALLSSSSPVDPAVAIYVMKAVGHYQSWVNHLYKAVTESGHQLGSVQQTFFSSQNPFHVESRQFSEHQDKSSDEYDGDEDVIFFEREPSRAPEIREGDPRFSSDNPMKIETLQEPSTRAKVPSPQRSPRIAAFDDGTAIGRPVNSAIIDDSFAISDRHVTAETFKRSCLSLTSPMHLCSRLPPRPARLSIQTPIRIYLPSESLASFSIAPQISRRDYSRNVIRSPSDHRHRAMMKPKDDSSPRPAAHAERESCTQAQRRVQALTTTSDLLAQLQRSPVMPQASVLSSAPAGELSVTRPRSECDRAQKATQGLVWSNWSSAHSFSSRVASPVAGTPVADLWRRRSRDDGRDTLPTRPLIIPLLPPRRTGLLAHASAAMTDTEVLKTIISARSVEPSRDHEALEKKTAGLIGDAQLKLERKPVGSSQSSYKSKASVTPGPTDKITQSRLSHQDALSRETVSTKTRVNCQFSAPNPPALHPSSEVYHKQTLRPLTHQSLGSGVSYNVFQRVFAPLSFPIADPKQVASCADATMAPLRRLAGSLPWRLTQTSGWYTPGRMKGANVVKGSRQAATGSVSQKPSTPVPTERNFFLSCPLSKEKRRPPSWRDSCCKSGD